MRRTFGISLGVILILGAALRFGALGIHSFWFDEVVAMRVAGAPTLGEFAERLARLDMVAAPLHPLLLRYWTAVWGTSEAAARGLSAAISVLGLGAFAAAAWQAFRSRAATLTATALLAVCPLDLAYAMETRMYSLLAFWTTASWALLFSFRRGRSRGRELAFGLCLVGLAYTHPLGGLMIVALAAAYGIDARRSMLRPSRWLAIQALAFAAILPWVGRYLDHPPDPKTAGGLGTAWLNWVAYGLGWPVGWLPPVLGVVALAWLVPDRRRPAGATTGDGTSGEERLRTGLMLCAWVASPIGLMTAYTWLRHPILGPLRYHLFLMPGAILLVAGAARFRPLAVGGLATALVLGFTLPSLKSGVYDEQRKPAWREATREMLRSARNPVVVLDAREPNMYFQTVAYYLPERVPVISLQVYLDRLAAGTLDRAGDYWLFRDALIDKSRAVPEPASATAGVRPVVDLGRLTVARLAPLVRAAYAHDASR
ncbi:glycosyltransferase family 39 protein [Paludisphaera mucosa]|uniref:Glycosyltransferase family 39 protein n=1 Tax=Paludisphaera mucosa TaxID=3030827 RepID=A0ABT6FIQ8_9BACT|nr:glycosyltransferase family 39 protein [Paludisphaera mucosa]MDG3007430.1 glycosyltransferase family 39 protein [Paludisphaera mucosa]